MVTLKDIALKANVSTMTVSRVVNGQTSKVSKKTADRITKIIEETGYVPNNSARNLSSKNSRIITIFLQSENENISDPYTSKMLATIIPKLQKKNYYTMLAFLNNFQDITHYIRTWNVAGAIFLGVYDDDIIKIKENQIPLIFTDSYSPVRQITNIGIDDYKGGVLAANHFIDNGHTSFAFIGMAIEHSGVTKNRLNGFRDTLQSNGFSLDDNSIIGFNDNCDEIADRIINLKNTHTAIFCTADQLAINLMDTLIKRGYNIPNDFSFIGFDNLPISYYVTPKLTTISQDIDQKSTLACDTLLKHIEEKSLLAINITLDVQLIDRDSVKKI